MSLENHRFSELEYLLESLCEDRITREEAQRLETLVLNDSEARRFYLNYIDLHGSLYWDAATIDSNEPGKPFSDSIDSELIVAAATVLSEEETANPAVVPQQQTPQTRRRWIVATTTVCSLLFLGFLLTWFGKSPSTEPNLAQSEHQAVSPEQTKQQETTSPENQAKSPPTSSDRHRKQQKIVLERPNSSKEPGNYLPNSSDDPQQPKTAEPNDDRKADNGSFVAVRSNESIINSINESLGKGWESAGVTPSPRADDAEWIRRVYLDLVGHIPPPQAVEKFLSDDNPRKRSELIEKLLDHPDYVYNWATIWTNLLVGRSMEREVNRSALRKFLRESFARNRPWSEVVYDLVAAEGRSEENGATNFLLAHLNNDAVPATAITARVLMGRQIHCMQCHHHPFNDWKQSRFWELNSFFQQTEIVRHQRYDPQSGKMVAAHTELVSRNEGGPIYFENRQGLMRVAFPEFEGKTVNPNSQTNRRRELAALMIQGEKPQVAEALVNRMWSHFFGYGFTRPVDDMGPHNAPTHPELLDRLSRKFVDSGYDIKQLIRWICHSEAYHLTSQYTVENEIDAPASGESPLFSRMYVKPMTAEQLYDSLLVATKAHQAGHSNWETVAKKRQEWLQQFVIAFENEENTEATNFNGTVPQALMMMNGDLVQRALTPSPGTYLHKVLHEKSSDVEKIRKLCLSALSRYPTEKEVDAIRKHLRTRSRNPANSNRKVAMAEGLQDAFWAFLNSSEFILVH